VTAASADNGSSKRRTSTSIPRFGHRVGMDRETMARRVRAILHDQARGRDVLSRFVAPVVLAPMNAEGPGRSYRATGAFNLSFFLSGDFSGSGFSGCAGAQCGLCTAITLGVERRLAA
jgi:hypothetical protein